MTYPQCFMQCNDRVQHLKIKPLVCKTYGSRSRWSIYLLLLHDFLTMWTDIQRWIAFIISYLFTSMKMQCTYIWNVLYALIIPYANILWIYLWTKVIFQNGICRILSVNIESHSYVCSLKVMVYYVKIIFIDMSHLIKIFCIANRIEKSNVQF